MCAEHRRQADDTRSRQRHHFFGFAVRGLRCPRFSPLLHSSSSRFAGAFSPSPSPFSPSLFSPPCNLATVQSRNLATVQSRHRASVPLAHLRRQNVRNIVVCRFVDSLNISRNVSSGRTLWANNPGYSSIFSEKCPPEGHFGRIFQYIQLKNVQNILESSRIFWNIPKYQNILQIIQNIRFCHGAIFTEYLLISIPFLDAFSLNILENISTTTLY